MIFVKFYTLSAINVITKWGANFDKMNISSYHQTYFLIEYIAFVIWETIWEIL